MRRWVLIILTGAGFLAGCVSRRMARPPDDVQPAVYRLNVSAYSSDPISTGWTRNWWGRPVQAYGPNKGKPKKVGVTATGARATLGTIAADQAIFPYGTVMYVPGYGYGLVEDCGSAIKGNRIDLYFHSRGDALRWGRVMKDVTVWYPPGRSRR